MADMSFLPEDYLEKRLERRTNMVSLVLFLIVMGAVVGAYLVTDRQRTDVRQLQARVNGQYEEAARRLEQLEQLQEQKRQMMRKARITGSLLEPVPRTVILAELINNMPAALSLLELDLQTKVLSTNTRSAQTALEAAKRQGLGQAEQPAEPEVKPTQVTMQLIGMAATDVQVAQFMTSLSQVPLFTHVNLAFSEEMQVDGSTLRKFRIDMTVNQNVDPKRYEPTMVQRELKQDPMADTTPVVPAPDSAVTPKRTTQSRQPSDVPVVPIRD